MKSPLLFRASLAVMLCNCVSASAQQLSSATPHVSNPQATAAPTCASRDIDLITMMEERSDGSFSSERLLTAHAGMMSARRLCRDGRTADGLTAYDAAALALRTE